MPKISFRIRSNKTQAENYVHLYPSKKIRRELPIGISVRNAFWHKRNIRVTDGTYECPQVNEMIEQIEGALIGYLNTNGQPKLEKRDFQAQVLLALVRPVKMELKSKLAYAELPQASTLHTVPFLKIACY
jgi:hypothetical protein